MLYELTNNTHISLSQLSVKKKKPVYRDGSSANGFYYVKSGLVGLYQLTESGKESLLRIYGPGSFFGYRSLFTEQKYPATSRTMLDSELLKVNVNDFSELESIAPNIASYLMREVCEELGEAEKRLMQHTSCSAIKRIVDAIYYLFTFYPSYSWTYREIGEYSGTDTTTVIRYCKTLKQEGYLKKDSRKPIPTDMQLIAEFRQSIV
ncbi:Crp/Fnr family transcriptional regulator [Psychromonas sp.]|uniref:Crp/Fnr family transcriptional regulator n=1 Tax=Psychromonas sp. TaxID=1884585 RepID=UPI003564FD27